MQNVFEYLSNNTYPGRGIISGLLPDGETAVFAYFIMGRSVNSRNRIFAKTESGISTKAFDESKLTDPSLVIYHPVRLFKDKYIITNGDQTDTVFDYLSKGKTFADALRTREFEPDEPNYTPRISCCAEFGGGYGYTLSILKHGQNGGCDRYFYEYTPACGVGHIIHTYAADGDPLPTYGGEPVAIEIGGNQDDFTEKLWQSLNADNKAALWTCYYSVKSGEKNERIINKLI